MKKLFKRDTILAILIPLVFIYTSTPLGVPKVKGMLKFEYKVRSIADFIKANDTKLL